MDRQTDITELSADQLDQVTGGTLIVAPLANQLQAPPQLERKLALRILNERSERQTQVVQKITS
jgi:hypothetical protein